MIPGLQRWLDARRQANGPHAGLFAPYRGQEWVAIDCEATGLDPRRDQLLSVAAVPVNGTTIRLRERLVIHVAYDGADLEQAIRHHRLRPVDLASGLPLADAMTQLMAMLGNRPLVGYCIGFDRALLSRSLRDTLGFSLPQRCIDIRGGFADLWRRRHPDHPPDLRLEAMAQSLNLPVFERHDALGDALTAAAVHLAVNAERR